MKRIFVAAVVFALALGLMTNAFAAAARGVAAARWNGGYGYASGGGYGLMWDEDGEFLSRDAFEKRLDEAIEESLISEEYREDYLEMYDYCAEYGGGARGVRGGGCCGGRGMGWGRR